MQKIKSIIIKLVSSAGTGYFYATRKNPTNIPHKLAFMKYDPIVRQHVLFNEAKMPKSKGGRRAGK
jgi:large subunit ribosomal protein L33